LILPIQQDFKTATVPEGNANGNPILIHCIRNIHNYFLNSINSNKKIDVKKVVVTSYKYIIKRWGRVFLHVPIINLTITYLINFCQYVFKKYFSSVNNFVIKFRQYWIFGVVSPKKTYLHNLLNLKQ
jgi:hypothetical protein